VNVDIQMHAPCNIRVITDESNRLVNVILVVLRERLAKKVLEQNKKWKLNKDL